MNLISIFMERVMVRVVFEGKKLFKCLFFFSIGMILIRDLISFFYNFLEIYFCMFVFL